MGREEIIMKNRCYLQAVKDGFLVSLYLIFIWIVIFSPLGAFLPVFVTVILDFVIAITLSCYYFKKIKRMSAPKTKIIFSLISFICFFAIIISFWIIKIYFPFYIIPKRELTGGDVLWAIFDGIVFLFTLFIGRFIAFMSADKTKQSGDGWLK